MLTSSSIEEWNWAQVGWGLGSVSVIQKQQAITYHNSLWPSTWPGLWGLLECFKVGEMLTGHSAGKTPSEVSSGHSEGRVGCEPWGIELTGSIVLLSIVQACLPKFSFFSLQIPSIKPKTLYVLGYKVSSLPLSDISLLIFFGVCVCVEECRDGDRGGSEVLKPSLVLNSWYSCLISPLIA